MSIKAFYNEIDPYCCAWLSNLMDAGQITPGKIDDRPIEEITSDDVLGYDRAHFFAGIGGWDIALNLAGWGDGKGKITWTGSCPCQPFSNAGQKTGTADKRHLWPAWNRLIERCRPPVIFGEQVEAAIRQGWLDAVFDDLENQAYACWAGALPACSVGAPHIRQRLWFVAHRLGDTSTPGLSVREREGVEGSGRGQEGGATEQSGCSPNPWSSIQWLPCTDGKARPIEPGIEPLAYWDTQSNI
jgi:DNA (cytosine-5)-methyltransferase 1